MVLLTLLALLLAHAGRVALRLGLPQRLTLALGPLSLDGLPDRAAVRHGDRPLFTSDRPCAWQVPALRDRYPDRTAWSAARIRDTLTYLDGMLRHRFGLERGERVAILKQNHLDIHVLTASVVRAGGIACPINGKFAADKLHPYLLNVGARLLISDSATLLRLLREQGGFGSVEAVIVAEGRDARSEEHSTLAREMERLHSAIRLVWLEEALEGVRPEAQGIPRGADEPLYLVHSSGTTGFPKAVILKNRAQSHALRGWLCYVHISPARDKGFLAVPNNHQAVILSFNSLLLLGVRVHWTAAYDGDGFDAAAVVRELADGGYTGFFGFPIAYTQLKEVALEEHDLSRMRFWASTADASHEVVQRRFVRVGGAFRDAGVPIRGSVFLDAQGSSEVGTPSVIRYVTPLTRRFDRRIGRPGSTPFGPRTRVVKSDGTPARRGEVGRLEVRGRTVFAGYWNNHPLTLQAMRDGWFFTGDVVRRGEDGHLVQLDREVDVIHTATGDVYSLPIEERIHAHPAVFDTCVYGQRQPDGTQLPAAAVALRPGFRLSAEQLRTELNETLLPAERLCTVEILPWKDFPVGITGKTLKRVFRERTEREPVAEQNRPVVWTDAPPAEEPAAEVATACLASA